MRAGGSSAKAQGKGLAAGTAKPRAESSTTFRSKKKDQAVIGYNSGPTTFFPSSAQQGGWPKKGKTIDFAAYTREPAESNFRVPEKYQEVRRKVTMAYVAAPIAIVTSYYLWQRRELGHRSFVSSRS